MRKLQLSVESLKVDSFTTRAEAPAEGTVYAHATGGAWTCQYHCTWMGGTCADTTCGGGNTDQCTLVQTCRC